MPACRSPRRRILAVAVAGAVLAAPASAAGALSYTGTNLTTGTDSGGQAVSGLRADGVNNSGHVVGQAMFAGTTHPIGFLYADGYFRPLNGLPLQGPGNNQTGALDISNADYAIGNSQVGTSRTSDPTGDQFGVGWTSGSSTPVNLGVLNDCTGGPSGQSSTDSSAVSVNTFGDAAGRSFKWDCQTSSSPVNQAVKFAHGGAVSAVLDGSHGATAIDDNGTVAVSDPANSGQSVLVPSLTSLPFAVASGHGLSHSGIYAVGNGAGAKEWTSAGGTVALPPLPGDVFAQVNAVNNSGDAVGVSYTSSNTQRAVIWQNHVPTQLSTVTTGGPYLAVATAISDNGYIVGDGTPNNVSNAPPVFLLTPPLPVRVSVHDAAVKEPPSGDAQALVHVTLDRASAATVHVDYTTQDGTATVAAHEYDAAQGTLTFAPGETDQTVPVTIHGSGKPGHVKTFALKLSNVTPAEVGLGQDTGTVEIDSCLSASGDPDACPVGVSGTVTDTRSAPVPGARIVVRGTDQLGSAVAKNATTGADGSYGVQLRPGSYDVDATTATPAGQPSRGTWANPTCTGTFVDNGICHLVVDADHPGVASFLYHLPDVKAEDVEITQGAQKLSWETSGPVAVPRLGAVGGASYAGVKLVRDVPTVVRVYAHTDGDAFARSTSDVPAVLHAYGPSGELAGSPIAAAAARTLRIGPSLPGARTDANGAYAFTLPPAWTEHGTITLAAEIDPPSGGEQPVHQCVHCTDNDVRGLRGISFVRTGTVTVHPFQFVYTYPRVPGTQGPLRVMRGPDLTSHYERARDVLPIARRDLKVAAFPSATIDITAEVRQVVADVRRQHVPLAKPDLSDCISIPACREALTAWEYDAIARDLFRPGGAHDFLVGFSPIPDGQTWDSEGVSVIGTDTPPRLFTSTMHEFLHLFGILHASAACGGGGANGNQAVAWPPDQRGHLNGIGLDRRPGSGGPGTYRIIAPGVGSPQWYDLMSYCSNLSTDGDAWISPRNWDAFVRADGAASGAARESTASAAASGPRMMINALISGNGSARVLGAGATAAAPTPVSRSSPYRLALLGAGGHVVRTLAVAPIVTSDSNVRVLSAVVPSAGVQGVEILRGRTVLATKLRPSPAPRVTLRAPKVRGDGVTVRWRGRGARGVALRVKVMFAAGTSRTFSTIAGGLRGSSASIPVKRFAGARRVRIRVVLNDGFTDASATSATVRLPAR